MNLNIRIDTKGAILQGKGPEIIQKGLDRFVTSATMFLLGQVKMRTPQGVYGAQGGLLGSIQADVQGRGTPHIRGIVATAHSYGEVVERGRQPGRGMPPQGALQRWIEVKFGLSPEAAKRIEFVVRRKIGQKGFEGAHMFEKALTENIGKLQQMAEREGFTIATEMNA